MISGIGSSASYYSSLFAANGTSGPGTTNSASQLAQTEEKLFAAIDSNGDGSISQSEFSNFLNQTAAATGASTPTQAASNTLFSQMSGGGGSISLQQFEANAGDLVSQLQSEIAAGQSSSSSATSALLSQLSQSAASLAAGSAASITAASQSNAASNTNNTSNSGHHHHHGHGGGGGGSLISQFMQQYQAAGATSTTATTTVSASV
jgi:EF hand